MDDPSAQLAPLIHGFTPVNRPSTTLTSGEASAAISTSPQAKKPTKAKQARKENVSAPRASRKRRSDQAPVSKPPKKSKSSAPRRNLKSDDISKELHRTKPGLAHGLLETIKTNTTLPRSTPPIPGIEPASYRDLDPGCRHEVQQSPEGSIKPGNCSLGETYQSAFATTATGTYDGDQHPSSPARPHSHGGNVEAMMENLIDDDSSFKCLDARPEHVAADPEHWLSSRTVLGDGYKDEREVDLSHPSGEGNECNEGDSLFDEALERGAPLETDISRVCSSVVDQATIAGSHCRDVEPSGYIQEPVSALRDVMQHTTSRAPESPIIDSTPDGLESENTDEFPVDEDNFPIVDEQECFECDRYGDKLPDTDAADSIADDGPPLIVPDPFADEDLDAELMNMSTAVSERIPGQSPPLTQTTPPRSRLQWTPPTPHTPAQPTQTPNATIQNSNPVFITPRLPLSALSPNAGAQCISPSKDRKPLPFIRPSFPSAVLPRSPIAGLSPSTTIRTCFRIGEALNAACIALRNSTDAVIELYCHVKYSDREVNGYKQFFELADLFTPEKPPSLNGVYAIWKGVDLWEYDSKLLVGARGRGRMARILGRIKRGKDNQGWDMTMLNVWEATWEVGSNLMGTRE